METILVVLIVAAAVGYLVHRFYRGVKAGSVPADSCGCGCSGCDAADTCSSVGLEPPR